MMFCGRLSKQLLRARQFHSTLVKNETKPTPPSSKSTTSKTKMTAEELQEHVLGAPLHTVGALDKFILVWVKRYPSISEVPAQVSIPCIQKAHTKARIYVCYMMMVFGIAGFFISSWMGKRDAAAGKNIVTERMKWYEEVREKGRKEKAAAEAAAAAAADKQ
ncbi:protein FAM162B-like [Ceratina calcarata]|uniref:Protein FAM162B-like n=1 Tax=Ceratina calcarata TaxID=156304 RepID=A0AAJ7NGR7_9HYME|nr:protein FAM162B-like [Ceratina calcarata]